MKLDGGENRIFSFPPVSREDSKILVLGTMPGAMSLKLNQYYGHGGNAFWKILFEIFDKPFTKDYQIRKSLALENGIAIWDVLQACERKGSSDNAIKEEVPNDFRSFFQKHPHLKRIVFNGKKPMEFFDRYVDITFDGQLIMPPSTSSANTWFSFEEKLSKWEKALSI